MCRLSLPTSETLAPARQSHSKGLTVSFKEPRHWNLLDSPLLHSSKRCRLFLPRSEEPAHPQYATQLSSRIVHGRLRYWESSQLCHQMMGSLWRVEQKTVSSQILIFAVDNMNRTHIDKTGNRLRLMDGERLSEGLIWMAQHSSGSRMRSRHDRDMLLHRTTLTKLMRWISTGTPRTIEARTDGRHADDDK